MPGSQLELIDFEKYLRLLQALLHNDLALVVYGKAENIVWEGGGFQERCDPKVLAWLRSRPAGDLSLHSREFYSNRQLYSNVLMNEGGEPMATLLFAAAFSGATSNSPEQTLEDGLNVITDWIARDYQLSVETDALANELADRYEELNLVYEVDQSTGEGASGLEAMQSLVTQYVEYLNVGMAVITLPEKGITAFQENEFSPVDDSHQVLEDVRGSLYNWAKSHQEAIVLNSEDHKKREQIGLKTINKLIAMPVDVGGDYPMGLLVILNSRHSPDFRNSDRNLLNAISKKLAKVIMSSYDALTGLENLNSFEGRLKETLLISQTRGGTHAVLNIDIDQLQIVNDIFNRNTGDRLIREVGRTIQQQLRSGDVVARTGGDEFCVLLYNCPLEAAAGIAKNIQKQVVGLNFEAQGNVHEVSVAIGLAPVGASAESYMDILSAVEVARNAAKERGRNKLQIFGLEDLELLRRKVEMKWVNNIQRALRDDLFELFAQPIVALEEGGNGPNIHFEILVRLTDNEGGILCPDAFMPAAEHYYLMPAIDRWVIDRLLSYLQPRWPSLETHNFIVSINLSGQSIGEDSFRFELIEQLQLSCVPADRFCFEITETAAIANLNEAKILIRELKEQGCAISLDDFGSGLSSFAYLKNLDVDYLKIDGSFVKDIADDQVSKSMVSAINQVGKSMGLATIAEWVESQKAADLLRSIGVDFGQGYHFGKPSQLVEQLDRCYCSQAAMLDSTA